MIRVERNARLVDAGEFQCYDEYMLSMLHAAALDTGHAEYGHGGPHDAGSYCQWPQQTKFFRCAKLSEAFNAPYGICMKHGACHQTVNAVFKCSWCAEIVEAGRLSMASSS